MHPPDYPYFRTEPFNSTYRESRDYNQRSKNATYIQKKYDNLDSSYAPSEKYKPSKYDQNNYYSPRSKKQYLHPYDLRNSVNVLPNYQQELQREKYRNKREHNDYNTARDKSPVGYNYKKEYNGADSRKYGRSPSPLSNSKYDLSMSSVSAHPTMDYHSKKNKYLEETTPQYLTKSNVGYVKKNYDDKNLIREDDKISLKEKYKSYFDTGKSNASEVIEKKYNQVDAATTRYDKSENYSKLQNKLYSSKSARDDYSHYDSKDYYGTGKTNADSRYKLYDSPIYDSNGADKRFIKKKYEQGNSPSTNVQQMNHILSKSKISRINSKTKIQIQKMEEKKKSSSTSTLSKEILPTFAYKIDQKASIYDFKLGKTKGEGKFGTVYMATHKLTDTLYAIKKIPKQIIKSHMLENQLALEIKLQSYINHPNILKLYGFFDDKQNIYLVLEYMEEGTLFEYLKKRVNKLTQKEVSSKIREVSSAIKYLHDLDIAHRDIKPQNIVLSGGVAKICDFGWATRCTDRRKTYCGTFDYAAPEILEGKEYDWCVDLWCLGVLTFQLLTGKVPFYHISRKQTMKKILRVDRDQIVFPPQISWKAKDFVESLIKKDPHERSRADELLGHPFLGEEKKETLIL